ncbi:putative transcriptional regulator [Mesorhizobium australicum WSM2073]|uniref:Helix-turn-helix domain protein n=3 Tax=Mesorhizobium TaxID=68287 RepID=E8TEH1_MESCW|nr:MULTISPECIES: helix-turn-helix transcriptional regulator [Mesorhizobium]ADV14586.1 helix-turn-helix domain protein [Mesorhizobium ciceri biovar biserrulae WSM1271]AEH90471.1 transcriptional regulator, XRE family [Mesorhizobium opportunistum WSM2075]AGB47841.1 putative transcriptional regulator [Mesorhizobium australicum WSM2073]OBP90050.1 transcriptional regulator [Mesorhizobium loti]
MARTPVGFAGPNPEAVRLGKRLKDAREYVGITQEEAANHLKVRRSAISEMEAGKRGVGALEMKSLAVLYERPTSWFTGESEQLHVPEDVAFLARTVSDLSENDRGELASFAEFLRSRSKVNKNG